MSDFSQRNEDGFGGLVFHEDGFASSAFQDRWRIGAVCIATANQSEYLLVQKAVKTSEKYEFSGMWSCPGGMLRSNQLPGTHAGTVVGRAHFEAAIIQRIEAEAGIGKRDLLALEPAEALPPLISSYTAKGQQRYTLIRPFAATLRSGVIPKVQDTSVSKAQFETMAEVIPTMSPANSIYGMLLAGHTKLEIRESAAWQQCREWAVEAANFETLKAIGVPLSFD